MTDHRQQTIQAPPSLEEVLAAGGTRVGRVDFAPAEEVTATPAPGGTPWAGVGSPHPSPEAHDTTVDRPAVTDDPVRDDPGTAAAPSTIEEPDVEQLVADSIALIVGVRDARVRHEDALLQEVARRCELIRARAELDAELTQLLARRRAHALVAAADPGAREADELGRLDELVRATSRFAGPESTDRGSADQLTATGAETGQ